MSIGSYFFSLKDTTLVAFTSISSTLYSITVVTWVLMHKSLTEKEELNWFRFPGADLNGIRGGRLETGMHRSRIRCVTHCWKGTKSYNSEAFDTRNYEIKYINIKPKISLRPTGRTKIGASYAWSDKNKPSSTMKKPWSTILQAMLHGELCRNGHWMHLPVWWK